MCFFIYIAYKSNPSTPTHRKVSDETKMQAIYDQCHLPKYFLSPHKRNTMDGNMFFSASNSGANLVITLSEAH